MRTERETIVLMRAGEFIASATARKRYWARSYLGAHDALDGPADRPGYPPVQHAEPNRSHYALAALQETGWTSSLITQSAS